MKNSPNTLPSLVRSAMILIEQAGKESAGNEKAVAFLNGAGALLSTMMDAIGPKEGAHDEKD